MNDLERLCRGMGNVYRDHLINAKKKLFDGIIVVISLCGAKIWKVGLAERRFNVMKIKCLRSMCGIILVRVYQTRSEEEDGEVVVQRIWLI